MKFGKVIGIYVAAAFVFAISASATTAKKTTPAKGKEMFAVFDTDHGKFKVKLFADKAPKTVENFVSLAEGTNTNPGLKQEFKGKHYFDGLKFHRIIANFMIQGGDPEGNGRGGPGYKFADEFSPDLKFDKKGLLAMANAGPNTNGSQFFITVTPDLSRLDNHYTIFGEVVEGYDVVEKLSQVPTIGDAPKTPPVIKSVKIEK